MVRIMKIWLHPVTYEAVLIGENCLSLSNADHQLSLSNNLVVFILKLSNN